MSVVALACGALVFFLIAQYNRRHQKDELLSVRQEVVELLGDGVSTQALRKNDSSKTINPQVVLAALQSSKSCIPRHLVLGDSMEVTVGTHRIVFYEAINENSTILLSIDGRGFLEVTDTEIVSLITRNIERRQLSK
jgi:hypothetical protein